MRSPADEGHARHTLGVTLAATGDLAAGLAELRRALDIAVRGGDVADAAGIHLHLWRHLVAEGRGAEVVDIAVADAATARATAMPVLAGVLDAIAAGYCHQLGRWAEADALLTNLDPQRIDGIVQLVVAAALDVDRGDVERAGDRLETVRAATFGLRDGRIDGMLFRGLAERGVEPRPHRCRCGHRRRGCRPRRRCRDDGAAGTRRAARRRAVRARRRTVG